MKNNFYDTQIALYKNLKILPIKFYFSGQKISQVETELLGVFQSRIGT